MKSQRPLNILFAGTPSIAATVLSYLIESDDCYVSGVLTQPDKRSGRGKKRHFSSVKQMALAENIPVYQPASLSHRNITDAEIDRLQPDMVIVVAYGLMLPAHILNWPLYGCLNVHFSLLPRWRGASPVQHALLAGDQYTGVSIIRINQTLDTGDILAQTQEPIMPEDTTEKLSYRLAQRSGPLLLNVLPRWRDNLIEPVKQPKQGRYAPRLTKQDGQINWEQSAYVIKRQIRALMPWPSAYTMIEQNTVKIGDGEVGEQSTAPAGDIIKVGPESIDISTMDHILHIKQLQLPGKKMLSISQVLNGRDLSHWQGRNLITENKPV
jgi:methionyl-tRNA formyltransferase